MNVGSNFLVAVRSYTYNHSAYITETMNGFTMQKTSFPYVCIIVDDASTDGEPDVIRQYLNENFELGTASCHESVETDDYIMTFAQHKTNRNCYFAAYFLKYNHYRINKDKFPHFAKYYDHAKYVALCEGDDYWCHPEKLQMQVDFLENHTDYGMVHTDFNLTSGMRRHVKADKNDDGVWFPRILDDNFNIGTATVVFRKAVFDSMPKLYLTKNWPMSDKAMWYEMAHESKIKYIPIVTACYRILETSASHSKDINKMIAFKNAGVEIRLFYADYYGIDLGTDGYGPCYYEDILRYACRLGEKSVARDYYNQARSKGVLSRKGLVFYLATLFPALKSFMELFIKV